MTDTPRCQWRTTVPSEDGHEVFEICCNDGVKCDGCVFYYCDAHRPLHGHEA